MKILLKLYPKINLGDDLFLKIICERYPHHDFYLLAGAEYDRFCEVFPNLHLISPDFEDGLVSKVLRTIGLRLFSGLFKKELQKVYKKQYKDFKHEFDGFVSIGGSIFMQATRDLMLDNEIAFYDLLNEELPQIPKFFIGCNFGPYKNLEYVSLYKNIFIQAKDVCFREKYSAEIFKNIPSVRWAPDVVFGMPVEGIQKDLNNIGFSIIKARDGINENEYYLKYAGLINSYLESGKNVYLFSFCQSEGDEQAINSIDLYINSNQKVHKVFYDGNIEEFLSIYGKMHTVYCGRFHAMILSMLFKQQIYPVVYSEKMINVLNDVNYEGKVIHMRSFHEIRIDKVIEEVQGNKYDISMEQSLAKKQFSVLDEFLKNESN